MKKIDNPMIKSVISSMCCILGGIIFGFLIMFFIALLTPNMNVSDAFAGFIILLQGPFSSGSYVLTNFGDMMFYATPLILTGLSVAIAFNTGLFNIGAPGQMLIGTMASLFIALSIHSTNAVSGFFVWLLAVIFAIICGMLWGAIPGFFKAIFGVNEVIVCIMTNWIAANLTSWFFSTKQELTNTIDVGKSSFLFTTAHTGNGTPTLGLNNIFKGSYIDIGILISILVAIIIYVLLNKTNLGYELKACGFNRHAAKYAGMNPKKNIVLSMAIAGGLAALGASLYYLNPGIEFKYSAAYSKLPDYGFNGIPASLLASNNPIGVIFSGLFLRYLSQGGDNLVSVGFNRYISDIIIAVIIYFAGFANLIRMIIERVKFKNNKGEVK